MSFIFFLFFFFSVTDKILCACKKKKDPIFVQLQKWAESRMQYLNIALVEPLACTLLESPLYFKGCKIDSSKMYRTICFLLKVSHKNECHTIKIMEIHVKPECSWSSNSKDLVGASFNVNPESKELYVRYPLKRVDGDMFCKNPERFKNLLVFSGHQQMKSESLKLIGNRKGDLVCLLG